MLGRAVRIGIFRVNCFQIRRIARFLFPGKESNLVVCKRCGLIMVESEGVDIRGVWLCQKCVLDILNKGMVQFFNLKRW